MWGFVAFIGLSVFCPLISLERQAVPCRIHYFAG
jgi:hypothetical protein